MGFFLAGLLILFGVHSVSILAEGWRDRMAARLGEGLWKGLYSLAALAGFVLLVWGYAIARGSSTLLYAPPGGLRHLAMLLLVPVFPLLLAAYVPGRIRAAVKHPLLLATLLWACAHLLVNGRLVDLLLFGAFLVWAAADLVSLRRRPPRSVPTVPSSRFNDALAVVGGIAIYLLFLFWLHEVLIGVPLVGF